MLAIAAARRSQSKRTVGEGLGKRQRRVPNRQEAQRKQQHVSTAEPSAENRECR